jgi:hypothetical protein
MPAEPPRIGDFDVNRLKTLSIVLLAATLLPSGAALAREDNPAQIAAPGDGPVVHLFGPQSVFNKVGNVVPQQAQPQDQTAPAVNTAASAPADAAPATNAAATSTGSAGGLLHSMFVTGDGTPTSARLSQGRPGAR